MSNLTIEEIKQLINIVDLAEKYGAEPKHSNKNIIKCKYNVTRLDDKTSNLALYVDTNSWVDYPDKGGSIIDFIMAVENINKGQAIRKIKDMAGVVDDYEIKPVQRIEHQETMAKVLPDVIKKIFNYQQILDINNPLHKSEMIAMCPEWLYNEANEDDLQDFNSRCRFDKQHKSAFVLCVNKDIERGLRYRRRRKFNEKTMDFLEDEYEDSKWLAYSGTTTNFPYIRLKKDSSDFVIIVEGTHDYLTAMLCGYNVIAIPNCKFKLDDELLNNKVCIFIDDDDGKEFMKPLYEDAKCSKIYFNHQSFKKKHNIKKAKDFSDYVTHFTSLEAFKEAFNEERSFSSGLSSVAIKSRLKCVSDLIDNIIAPSWMIKNVLPSDGLMEIIGASNSYKTFIMLDMMYCISNGIDYHGMKTKKGIVIYIAGEGANGAKMRLRALRTKYGHNTYNFYMLECSSNLSDFREMDKLASEISAITEDKISLIVFDTLHRNTAGIDENSASDFSIVLGNVDKYLKPLCNLIGYIHHTGNGAETSMRGRGTSARFAAMDTSIVIHSKVKGNAGMTCVKQKDGDAFETIFFDMEKVDIDLKDEDGESLFSVVPVLGAEKIGEEKEDDDKISNDEYADIIRDYLIFEDTELNTNQIKEAMSGRIGANKCQKILKEKKYKDTHWCNFKKDGSKNEWVYKARQKFDGCTVVTYTEDDYKVELPICLR